jgi:hypothetical protein
MGLGLKRVPGQQLALAENRIHRTVKIQSLHWLASHALVLHQPQQGFLGPHVEHVIQLLRKIPGRGVFDDGPGRIQQGALAGEPDGLERPPAVVIEVRVFI